MVKKEEKEKHRYRGEKESKQEKRPELQAETGNKRK